jgi:hypothetical protein
LEFGSPRILEKRLRALREGGVMGFGLSTIDNCETN